MNIALIVDDFRLLDYLQHSFLSDVRELEDFLGMRVCAGRYKNTDIQVFWFNSVKDAVALRAEDLFLFKDLDVILNVGYCYIWQPNNKISEDDLVLISSSKCDENYRGLLNLDDDSNRRTFELDKKIEKRIVDVCKNLNLDVKLASCYSSSSVSGIPAFPENKFNCPVFDQKSFAIYEMAARHNRLAICLYKVRDFKNIDLHDYLSKRSRESLNDLIKLALEFSTRL